MGDLRKYCIDANVLIQAWQKYYAPDLCPSYWEMLNKLGAKGIIFISEEVRNEIIPKDNNSVENEDGLSKWLKKSPIPIHKTNEGVINCWRQILQNNPQHKLLVDNDKGRSLADPWVIAHAMNANAIVVTKENLINNPNAKKPITIPNVCNNMGIQWMDDFTFVREVGIKFECKI